MAGRARTAVATAPHLAAPTPVRAGPSVIEVADLAKSYGDQEAVRGIDLEVHQGEVFAFLGPNGAGKTTTVEILEGFRSRTSGTVSVLGADPAVAGPEWRARIGVVLQESEPEPELTVEECMALYAGYYPQPRPITETLELVGLADRVAARCRDLSGGQRRRLDVALALVGDPELLFLDEPTTGFDPAARRGAWEVIAGLRSLGKTIFLTTHYMDEAEFLAERIAVIANGRIVAQGTPEDLGGRSTRKSIVRFTIPEGMAHLDPPIELRGCFTNNDGHVTIETNEALALVGALARWAHDRGVDLPDLVVSRPSLEDVYLELTKEP